MPTNAFLFPGQGSQYVGMGAELVAAEPEIVGYYLGSAEEASGCPSLGCACGDRSTG